MKNPSAGEKFEQRDFEKPGLLFRFCLAVIRPLLTGPELYRPFVDGLDLKGSERVLELGCGNGVLMTYLAKSLGKGGSATGVDTSSYMTERARKRLAPFSNTEILRGDIRTLELKPGSFDLVIFIHVLHDIAPQERQDIMDALSRLLVPGGRLCLMEPVSPSHGMPVDDILSLAGSAGLSVTGIAPMGRRVRISCLK